MNILIKHIIVSAIFLSSTGVNAELMGHWSGDGNTNDFLGNNNGTLINDVTYADGYLNQAFVFDGNQDAVYLGTDLDVTNELTVSAWFNTSSTEGEQQIFNNESSYEIALRNGVMAFAIMTDVTSWYWVYSDWEYNLNEWTYVSMTYDGAAIKLYDEIGTERFSHDYEGIVTNGSQVRIGARSSNNNSFRGMIDEVSVYNSVETPLLNNTSSITSVPLSASLGLLSIGLLGFSARRKRN